MIAPNANQTAGRRSRRFATRHAADPKIAIQAIRTTAVTGLIGYTSKDPVIPGVSLSSRQS
jgi:hypothetical protein